MNPKVKAIVIPVLLAALDCTPAPAQPTTILTIDLDNLVEYRQGLLYDPSQYATDPNITTFVQARNFGLVTLLGDIVAVNGQPAKGLYVGRSRGILATPTPSSGQAIADVTHSALREHVFKILKSDGTPIGTIVGSGLSGGAPPPGAPLAQQAGDWAITGGTGAFLGIRGQTGAGSGSLRGASMAEDPAYRRTNGGGKQRYILHVIPMTVPQVVTTASGPAVTHSNDFSLVTASKAAKAGEILSVFATGLGPTRPAVDTGKPFPAGPPAVVNSPVEVMVNGRAAEVVGAVGYPGSVDGYQVNFRIPADAAPGSATIQLSAAWITGPEVKIAIQ